MKSTVVLLLSDKRSGSTMIQRELCRHKDIQTVAYSPHTYLETHHWLKAAVMLDVDDYKFSNSKVYDGYGSSRNARTYMEDCIVNNVPEFDIPKDDRELVFKGWEALCKRFATPVFFEKSPQFLAHWGCIELILDWVQKTDYDVKIIGLVRNPLSVMYSAYELFHTDPFKRQVGWVSIYNNLLTMKDIIDEDKFLLCRYEDIIKKPVKEFSKICHFIGIQPDGNLGSGVHGSSINKWEKDPFFTFQLDQDTRDMAMRFGYLRSELVNPDKPPPPMPHRLKKRASGSLKLFFAHFKDRFLKPIQTRRKLKKSGYR